MKMEARALEAIRESIRHTRDTIGLLACPGGGFWEIEDEELRKIYLELNKMCLTMSGKIRKAEEEGGNG